MKKLFCAIQIYLLTVISTSSVSCNKCVTSTASHPIFPKCNQKLIKEIKLFWSKAGTPTNVLQKIAEGEYSVVLTSRNYVGGNYIKCVFQNTTCDSSIIFTLPCKNPCGQPIYHGYKVEKRDGIILDSDDLIYRYTIFEGNNVIASYICNNKDGTQGPPAGSIYVNKDSINENSTQFTRRSMEGLMDIMGFEFVYSFGTECF